MATAQYLPPVLLGSVAALYYPSSEILWIVMKVLLFLALLHSVSEGAPVICQCLMSYADMLLERLAELAAATKPDEVMTEEAARALGDRQRAAVSLAEVAVGVLSAPSRRRRG